MYILRGGGGGGGGARRQRYRRREKHRKSRSHNAGGGGGGREWRTETESRRENVLWEGKTCPPRPVPNSVSHPLLMMIREPGQTGCE